MTRGRQDRAGLAAPDAGLITRTVTVAGGAPMMARPSPSAAAPGTAGAGAGLCRRGFPAPPAAGHRTRQMRIPARPGRVRQAGTQTRHHSRRRLAAARSGMAARPPGQAIRHLSPVPRPAFPGRRLPLAPAGGRACAVSARNPARTVTLLDGHAMPRPG